MGLLLDGSLQKAERITVISEKNQNQSNPSFKARGVGFHSSKHHQSIELRNFKAHSDEIIFQAHYTTMNSEH